MAVAKAIKICLFKPPFINLALIMLLVIKSKVANTTIQVAKLEPMWFIIKLVAKFTKVIFACCSITFKGHTTCFTASYFIGFIKG